MNQTGAVDFERVVPMIKRVTDPYWGGEVVVVPAVETGCCHRSRPACRQGWERPFVGYCRRAEGSGICIERVILTAEEIVDEAVIRSDPNRTLIPGFIVSAVCHVPGAAHPSYAQGYYDRDNDFYLKGTRSAKTPRQSRLICLNGFMA